MARLASRESAGVGADQALWAEQVFDCLHRRRLPRLWGGFRVFCDSAAPTFTPILLKKLERELTRVFGIWRRVETAWLPSPPLESKPATALPREWLEGRQLLGLRVHLLVAKQ
jgi:hypothetical protein